MAFLEKSCLSWKKKKKQQKVLNRDLTGTGHMFSFRLQPADRFHPLPSPWLFVLMYDMKEELRSIAGSSAGSYTSRFFIFLFF